MVCFIGGVAGVVAGIGGGLATSSIAGWRVIFTLTPIVIAFACAFLTGIVFGYLPARKAAQLDPIEALARATSSVGQASRPVHPSKVERLQPVNPSAARTSSSALSAGSATRRTRESPSVPRASSPRQIDRFHLQYCPESGRTSIPLSERPALACYDVAEILFFGGNETWVRWVGRKRFSSFSSL